MVSVSKRFCILFVIILSVSKVLEASDATKVYRGDQFGLDSNKLCKAGLGECGERVCNEACCIAKCNYEYANFKPRGYCAYIGSHQLCYCDYQC
ncbi:hypothetical protein CASFOL_020070 [Castilleja foliolosa]|uniref:Defensin-like protein n=1 Tax=Castilleja foliolosa TaxID=1961234 RepID=A0ABD3D0K2_9LAMI